MENQEQDAADWENAWSKMQHRKVENWNVAAVSKVFGNDWNRIKITTISVTDNPPHFANRVFRNSRACLACGTEVDIADGIPISLYPTFEVNDKRRSIGFGAWMHSTCFAACPTSKEPPPIPW